MNHTHLTRTQRAQILQFLDDCPMMGVTPTWACLAPKELPGHVRQIRRADTTLAEAIDSLGYILVLTPDLRRLQLTVEEYSTL